MTCYEEPMLTLENMRIYINHLNALDDLIFKEMSEHNELCMCVECLG
jgi:hypothetical protein